MVSSLRRSLMVGGALFVGVCAGLVAVLPALFARRVVTPSRVPPAPLRVREVVREGDVARVVFEGEEDAALAGRYSFIFDEGRGHARVGGVFAVRGRVVERELIGVDRGSLKEGARGRLTGWWYAEPEELGFPVTEQHIQSRFGALPTWWFENPACGRERVAIHVHGRGSSRAEVLRAVPPVMRAGWSSLVMSYRNDPEAGPSADAKYGLGERESEDVRAVIREAVLRGAREIVLVGWSMGATAVLIAAEESEYRGLITAMVLESPGIDWPDILQHQAGLARMPGWVARIGATYIARGSRVTGLTDPVRVGDLTAERFAASLRVPTLMLLSDGDTFVPNRGALRLAELRADLVTVRNVAEGEHVRAWNMDAEGWEQAIEAFLSELAA